VPTVPASTYDTVSSQPPTSRENLVDFAMGLAWVGKGILGRSRPRRAATIHKRDRFCGEPYALESKIATWHW
jgi:hypothetical protein